MEHNVRVKSKADNAWAVPSEDAPVEKRTCRNCVHYKGQQATGPAPRRCRNPKSPHFKKRYIEGWVCIHWERWRAMRS